jgi:glycerate 2-kinase
MEHWHMGKRLDMTKPQWDDRHKHLHAIARAALRAVDPFDAVKRHLLLNDNVITIGQQRIVLGGNSRIFVVGAGKAGVAMARAAESILGERIYGSLLSVPDLPDEELPIIRFSQGGHPLPTEGSIHAGERIKHLLDEAREQDLVLVLISGGGSALLELPLEGLSLSDLQDVNDLLIKSGASIQEINIIRRQLSMIKGGGLARMAVPANIVALILSDVVGNALETIASGPTTPGKNSVSDVWDVLEKYDLESRLPENVKKSLDASLGVKQESSGWNADKVTNIIIGSNEMAAKAAIIQAQELGFKGILLTTRVQGEAKKVGRSIAGMLKGVKFPATGPALPICIVLGGETTVIVRGSGIGGRNQELALAAAIDLENIPDIALMTLATDGIDGPTPYAGAIIDGGTIPRAHALGLEAQFYLENNDSYTFFNQLGDGVKLGPTGTNVNDLTFCLVYSS